MYLKQFIYFLWIILDIILILVPLIICVAYTTFFERKVMAFMQSRVGPNRFGPHGLLQAFADVFKLITKEIIHPTASNKYLYLLGPVLALAPAFIAWGVIPFNPGWVLANVNAGLLYLFAATSLGIYGILIAGWSSNSKYAFLGAMRSAAQVVSYEIAMGFCFVGVLVLSGSLNLSKIVMAQAGGFWHWYFLPLFPLFIIYWISAVAETNRSPFDITEGESEIVAGFHVEYSGVSFALFFLAEYANNILVYGICAVLFFGGWMSPFAGIPGLDTAFAWVPGIIWMLLKMSFFIYLYVWIRATFPRYRYDQLMHLGWKVLIPVTIVWILLVSIAVEYHVGYWV